MSTNSSERSVISTKKAFPGVNLRLQVVPYSQLQFSERDKYQFLV
jgi:hypothetical protein